MHWLEQFKSILSEVGFAGLADIAIVALVFYVFLVALKRTRRSGLILAGILIASAVYVLALKLDLLLTVTLLHGFFTVILVALVVIFQEELRYVFERVGLWWVQRRLPYYKRSAGRLPRREVEILSRTLGDLAREKIGALVVLRGADAINRHLDGGEPVDGRLSEPLLKSIFDPHSLGHDGAVTIEDDRIVKLGCHLPLSKNLDKLPRSGTRHAAALGLSEHTDALCLVVSEGVEPFPPRAGGTSAWCLARSSWPRCWRRFMTRSPRRVPAGPGKICCGRTHVRKPSRWSCPSRCGSSWCIARSPYTRPSRFRCNTACWALDWW